MNSSTLHPDDELLIAYLDRRLDRSEQSSVDERLAREPDFRERLDSLQQSWDALDELPMTTWDAASAATTMSMVALTAEEERSKRTPIRPPPISPWMRRTLLVLASLLAGYACIAIPNRIRYRATLRDLPVAYRMDAYRAIGDLSFLRALDQEGVFSDDLVADDESEITDFVVGSERTLADVPFAITGDTAAIDQALDRVPVDAIPDLQNRSQRLAALPHAEQVALRQFHDSLIHQPDASHLFALLDRYHDWIAMLPSSDRAELMRLPSSERMAAIRDIVARQLRRHPDWMAITPGDLKHLHTWTADYVKRHSSELLTLLPDRQREMLNRIDADRQTWFLVRAIAGAPPRVKDNLPKLTDTEKIRFLEGLSPELTRKISTELQTHGTRAIFEVFHSMSVHRRGNPRRLEQFYEDLPPTEKEALLRMRPEQVPQELRERYWRRHGGPGPGRRMPPRPDERERHEWRPPSPPDDKDLGE